MKKTARGGDEKKKEINRGGEKDGEKRGERRSAPSDCNGEISRGSNFRTRQTRNLHERRKLSFAIRRNQS